MGDDVFSIRALRASARRRSTFCFGVSPGGPLLRRGAVPDPDAAGESAGAVLVFEPGHLNVEPDLEEAYGPVAVNRVASAAERDIVRNSGCRWP